MLEKYVLLHRISHNVVHFPPFPSGSSESKLCTYRPDQRVNLMPPFHFNKRLRYHVTFSLILIAMFAQSNSRIVILESCKISKLLNKLNIKCSLYFVRQESRIEITVTKIINKWKSRSYLHTLLHIVLELIYIQDEFIRHRIMYDIV